ncbi:MAG: hypothetical protein V4671_20310, partial [Armatimonadota bacterium]
MKIYIVPVVFLLLAGCSDSGQQSAEAPAAEAQPMAVASTPLTYPEALASLDGASGDTVKVNRFTSLLSQLDETFVEDEKQISDMTVRGQELLKEKGVSESLLNIMEGMNQIFPAKVENQKYAEYIAAYLTMRNKGMSH